ncbi:MAG: glycosyltransferase family 2 protein [Clostridia bacterium]|nr:glycosyltransferase family 2 protein [Clostridia bacterium]
MNVSVIIPFYQNSEWLRQALDSVFAQTEPPQEVIVVNDGAAEDIAPLCRAYHGRVTLIEQPHSGCAAARMNGIRRAKGEVLAFLDADDLWEPEKLAVQTALMEQGGYMWSATAYTTFGVGQAKTVCPFQTPQLCHQLLLASAQIGTPTVMVRRRAFAEAPALAFPLDQRVGEDTVLWCRLAAKYPLGVVPQALVKVRLRGENAHLTGRANIEARAAIWQKIKAGDQGLERPAGWRTRTGYRLCALLDRVLKNRRLPRVVNRALYALPYVLFRSDAKKLRKQLAQ